MALQPGLTILNKYRIVKLLGEGGMARVWLAEEPTFGKRLVALKEPRPNPMSDDAAEIVLRYQREVQVCAELEQAGVPQIVRAITAEPTEDGLLLVMAYMPGGDLASLIKQHPNGLPPERAVAIALDVLVALTGAHSHPLEIVHRDVKPSNILFDKEGRAYLADFGLAQLAGVSGRSQLRGGQHPGTPPYMAPEQERSSGYLSPAADLFALGCVLWEMLTGQRYKRSKPGTPPSQLRADVPTWLDELVMRALAEDAWERWQSAGEMAQALHAGQAAMRQAQEAAEAQRLAEEGARQAAAARRAAEEQALQEAERRAQVEAAERARREEEERQRQQQLALLFAEAKGLVEQQPAQALALLAQIRASDPAYPGLAGLERRAQKAQERTKRAGQGRPPWLDRGRVMGGAALLVVAVVAIWALRNIIPPGGDATPTPTATIAQPAPVVANTHTLAPPAETPEPPVTTSAPPTTTPAPPTATPRPPTNTPVPPTDTPMPPTHTPLPTDTPVLLTATPIPPTPQPDAVVNTQNANLRNGPGPVYPILASYAEDSPMEVLGRSDDQRWTQLLTLDGQTGWMSTSLLQFNIDLATVPTVPIPSTPVPVNTTKPRITSDSAKELSELREMSGHQDRVNAVAFSPKGDLLSSGGGGSSDVVRIWRVSDGQQVGALTGHTWFVYDVEFSPNGELLATASRDETVRLWRVRDGVSLRTFDGHASGAESVAFAPDGGTLATGGSWNDRLIRLYNIADGSLVRTLAGHQHGITGLAFSGDGNLLASSSLDGTVRLWNVKDGTVSHVFQAYDVGGYLLTVAFSPDDSLIVSGGRSVDWSDYAAVVWRVQDSTIVTKLVGHSAEVTSASFSPDGTLLATGSYDDTIRLWRLSDSQPLVVVRGSPEATDSSRAAIYSVDFSPDGTLLASGSFDTLVRLWGVD